MTLQILSYLGKLNILFIILHILKIISKSKVYIVTKPNIFILLKGIWLKLMNEDLNIH